MSRKRILFAWELGGNYGHISKIVEVARHLERGADLFIALRETGPFRRIAGDLRATLLPAPFAKTRTLHPGEEDAQNFAGMLSTEGWDKPEDLAGQIEAWRSLFDLVKPDVLVCQAAPTGLLAAQGAGFSKVVLGSGYDNPPLAAPMPLFDRGPRAKPELAEEQEAAVLATANAALVKLGSAPKDRFCDVLAADLSLLMCWPETDHYGPRAELQAAPPAYLGQMVDTNSGKEVSWRGGSDLRILAYLRPGSGETAAALGAFHRLGPQADIICAAPGLAAQDAARLKGQNVQVVDGPVKLAPLLDECTLGVNHSSSGTASTLLSAGVPQVLLPLHREQGMLTTSLARAGLAMGLGGRFKADAVLDLIAKVASNDMLRETVKAKAAEISNRSKSNPSKLAAQSIQDLM